jgi:hypothetical protein
MYRMEVHDDNSGFDDPDLVVNSENPLEVMEAQFTAIDDFLQETQYVIFFFRNFIHLLCSHDFNSFNRSNKLMN